MSDYVLKIIRKLITKSFKMEAIDQQRIIYQEFERFVEDPLTEREVMRELLFSSL